MASNLNHFQETLSSAILDAITRECTKVVDESIEAAKKRIEERLREVVAGVSLEVFQQINMRMHERELVISIRDDRPRG